MQADSDCEVSMQADSDVKFKSLNNDANWGSGKQSKNCVFLS